MGLELHPTKTRTVFCKDSNRKESYSNTSFDFLGYTFGPRLIRDRNGKYFVGFTPAVSGKAQTAMRQRLHDLHLVRRTDLAIEEIAQMINPILRGWIQYYGRFHRSAMRKVLDPLNWTLVRWVRRKYKRFRYHPREAAC